MNIIFNSSCNQTTIWIFQSLGFCHSIHVAFEPQYLDQQVAFVLSFVLFNVIKVDLMQRQLIGELNTQPTTHHVSLLEITPQRNHIWCWKAKTALTTESILCFIISLWLGMLFCDTIPCPPPDTPCAPETGPKGILSQGPLKSCNCHTPGFALASRVGRLATRCSHSKNSPPLYHLVLWHKDDYWTKNLVKRAPWFDNTQTLLNAHSSSCAGASLCGTKDRLGQQQINKHMKDLVATGSALIFMENDKGRPLKLLQAKFISNCWGNYWMDLSIVLSHHRLLSHLGRALHDLAGFTTRKHQILTALLREIKEKIIHIWLFQKASAQEYVCAHPG